MGTKNNFAEGFKKGNNYETLAQLASTERPLLDKGYKISSELSPLSMFIILSEMKKDLTQSDYDGFDFMLRMLEARVRKLDL